MRSTVMRYLRALSRYLVVVTVFSGLLWQENALAGTSDWAPIVNAALENLDATNLDEDWYFTMEVLEEDELQIIHSDPRRDTYEKRQLLTVDGIAPDSQRLNEFHDKEVKRITDIDPDPDARGYGYMVDTQTLELIEASDGYAVFSFAPRVKMLEDSRDQLRGTLLLDSTTQRIDEIEIINTDKLSPAFSVTLDTFRLGLFFAQEQGENLLQKLESHTAGKMGFLKSFDALVIVDFSEYTRAEP
jgi:hypothetical protein